MEVLVTRTLLTLAALIIPGCDAAVPTTDTVDPTDDSGSPDDGEPIEVVALEEDRVSFEVVGFDASPANLFHVLAAPTEPQPTLVALTVSNNGPTGEAHACAVSGRTLSSICEVLPTDHHAAGFPFLADITGDGRDDMVIRSAGAPDAAGFITVVPVAAAGFGTPVRTDLSLITPVLQAAGDFDDDGDLDLAVSSETEPAIALLRGDGTGAFTEIEPIDLGDALAGDVQFADVDEDGTMDLVAMVRPTGGTTELWVWSGGAGFPGTPTQQVIWAPLGLGLGDGGDLDDDGHHDFVGFGFGPATIHYGTGSGFEARAHTVAGTLIAVSQVVDLDGDGHLDITGTSGSAVGFSVLYGDGARDFPSFQNALMGQSARRDATVADFDGDGALDVAATGYNATLGATLQIAFQQ